MHILLITLLLASVMVTSPVHAQNYSYPEYQSSPAVLQEYQARQQRKNVLVRGASALIVSIGIAVYIYRRRKQARQAEPDNVTKSDSEK